MLSGLPFFPTLPIIDLDSDDDGIIDEEDQCPNTEFGSVVNVNGCSIDDLAPADRKWKNHGQYVKAVKRLAKAFYIQGLITKAEKKLIGVTAARSDIGKKNK